VPFEGEGQHNVGPRKGSYFGFTIWMGKGRKTGKYYPHVQPSGKSLQTIKDRVTSLTMRSRTIMPLEWVVNEVNATVRGSGRLLSLSQLQQSNGPSKAPCGGAVNNASLASGTRSETGRRDTPGLNAGRCTRGTGFTKCRPQRFGRGRMPCSEEHRKAVCGKTACTV